MDLGKSSQSVNCMDVDTRKRSLIERSLLEHIPILVSSNDLIFLYIRVRYKMVNKRPLYYFIDDGVFKVERLVKL